MDGAVEGALRGGHHARALHRLRRLRDLLPPRRHRLRPRAGRLQAVPPRGRARAGQLHPRREGLHELHPRLPPVPGAGSPKPTSTSSAGSARPDELSGIYKDILLTRASDDMVHRTGQDGGLVSAMLIWLRRARLHRRRPRVVPRRRGRRLEGQARASPPPTRRSWRRRAAATRTRPTRSPSDEAEDAGSRAAGPRRHELPVVGRCR